MEPQIPPRFEVREELYRSEQNVRLRAFDTKLEQEVVLEYSGEGTRQIPSASERSNALRQARMRAKVKHDKIQPLKEILEAPEAVVHVLEPRSGVILREILEEHGTLDPLDVTELGIELADALQALHAEGVVHRAISADNVLMDGPGQVSALTGFAFAKPIAGLGQSSLQYNPKKKASPAARALPHHPAPEQVAGQAADARSDVFALGCVLYRCLTARAAFEDHGAVWQEPVDPHQVSASIPKPLAAIIVKCLRHSPMSRYPTMLEVGNALREVRKKIHAKDNSGPKPRLVLWLGAAAAALLAASIWLVVELMTGDPFTDSPAGLFNQPKRGVVTATPGLASTFRRSIAVVIGMNYDLDPKDGIADLDHAESDANGMADDLEKLGFEVVRLIGKDATEKRIRSTLDNLDSSHVDDQVFVFIAGHGDVHSNTEGDRASAYILPADAEPRAPRKGKGNKWIHLDYFDRKLDEYKAKHVLLAFDCCRSGNVFQKRRSLGKPPTEGNGQDRKYSSLYLRAEAKVIMASCAGDQDTLDESFFAKGFREKLREAANGEPVIHSSIIAHIKKLGLKSGKTQYPRAENRRNTSGDFVFVKRIKR